MYAIIPDIAPVSDSTTLHAETGRSKEDMEDIYTFETFEDISFLKWEMPVPDNSGSSIEFCGAF